MQDIEVTRWTIPGSDGEPIYGNTHRQGAGAVGNLICCHGFKGYKDYGFFPVLCDRAAGAGLVAHRFNFSHSGMTENIETFERPELFEKDRWGRQVEDLAGVVAYVRCQNDLPVVVFGHSRGGVTGLLFAGSCYRDVPLNGLVTAASPDYACKMDSLLKDQMRAEGRLLSPSGRTGQDLYVGLDWLEEIEREPERYDPVLAAAHVDCPLLVVHGDDDATVEVGCAERLHGAARGGCRLEIIEGADHVFNCPNPAPGGGYASLAGQARGMIDLSVGFGVGCCGEMKGGAGRP